MTRTVSRRTVLAYLSRNLAELEAEIRRLDDLIDAYRSVLRHIETMEDDAEPDDRPTGEGDER